MEKIKEVKYEIVAKFEDTELRWEFDTLSQAKEQYEQAKKYRGTKHIECNEVVTTKVNLF